MRQKTPFEQYVDSSLWVVDVASILKTPYVALMPLVLIMWFISLFMVVCKKDVQYLISIANKSESQLLTIVINKRKGRPFMFDLWSIKNKLRAKRARAARSGLGA